MVTAQAFLFLLMLTVAKSEVDFKTTCTNDYRDISNKRIDVLKYCSNKLCIEKCCGPGKMFGILGKCMNKKNLFKLRKKIAYLESQANYSKMISSRKGDEQSKKNFVFVQNHRDVFNCTVEHDVNGEYEILEDGSLSMQEKPGSKKWTTIKRLTYCIDYKITRPRDRYVIKVAIRQIQQNPEDEDKMETFEIVGVLISSFFLLLVLVVYSLLPDLRNLSGLVLMAYTFSLLFAFIAKLTLIFMSKEPTPGFCKKITPVVYFAFMASIFWLSVISFDVWWGLRGFRLKRGTNRRGELVKFMWYGLFAWGTPLLITAIVTTLDNIDTSDLNISVDPSFEHCLNRGRPFDFYFKIPIGILIIINIVLFCMTVYNIWRVKRAVSKACENAKNNKQLSNRLATYAKLSVMMGVSWCLELLPQNNKLWVYILISSYNLLTGVAIFYLFVFKKKILLLLCKKFNIWKDFTKKLEVELSQHTKSATTRTTRTFSSIVKNKPKDQSPEVDLLQNCPNEEVTIV